jgi:hypothetical protein
MPWPQHGAGKKFCRAATWNSTGGLPGNFTNTRNLVVMRGEFPATPIKNAFARRWDGEHYWKAFCFIETTPVQRLESAMQKRRSL